jgi:hypothetical protein
MTLPPAQLFPIVYGIHGGRPSIDLSFAVEADGSCQVDVLTGYSLGQFSSTRLGTFSCRLSPSAVTGLSQWAEAASADNLGGQPPGTVSRFLAKSGQPLRPVGDGPPEEVERLLADSAMAALDSPVSAIEVRAAAEPDEAHPRLVVTSIGKEPFRLMLFAADDAGYWPRLVRDDPRSPEREVFVTYEEIRALVNQGLIQEGVVQILPGQSLSLPLPAGVENTPATGSFIFWRAGTGPERRILAGSWSLEP